MYYTDASIRDWSVPHLVLITPTSICLRRFVDAFINFPKPLVAAVNGPAIGISVTIMALYDFVYASDAVSVTRACTHMHIYILTLHIYH